MKKKKIHENIHLRKKIKQKVFWRVFMKKNIRKISLRLVNVKYLRKNFKKNFQFLTILIFFYAHFH